MKYLSFTIFIFILSRPLYAYNSGIKTYVDSTTLNQIRKIYYQAVEDEGKIDVLSELIKEKFSQNPGTYPPVILAYYGSLDALRAKHAFWPFSKMSYLSSSMNILKKAISEDPNNLEIRFIRFSILDHVPGFLGYGDELNSDLQVILKLLAENNFEHLEGDIQKGIIEYMLRCGRLNKEQVSLLKNKCVLIFSK
jgi:hypothetical protein